MLLARYIPVIIISTLCSGAIWPLCSAASSPMVVIQRRLDLSALYVWIFQGSNDGGGVYQESCMDFFARCETSEAKWLMSAWKRSDTEIARCPFAGKRSIFFMLQRRARETMETKCSPMPERLQSVPKVAVVPRWPNMRKRWMIFPEPKLLSRSSDSREELNLILPTGR